MTADTKHPPESRRLYRQIADEVAGLIRSGKHPPGTRLPAERELAALLGVSRPSLREALIALEVEGLVEVRLSAGVFVLERPEPPAALQSAPGPFELLHARAVVESECAALAATHATPAQLAAMKAALDAMRRQGLAGSAAMDADQRFHLCIAEASANSALVMLTQQLWEARRGPLYMQLQSHFSSRDSWRQALNEHAEILRAIVSRDAEAARAVMRSHLKHAERRFAANWSPDEPADPD